MRKTLLAVAVAATALFSGCGSPSPAPSNEAVVSAISGSLGRVCYYGGVPATGTLAVSGWITRPTPDEGRILALADAGHATIDRARVRRAHQSGHDDFVPFKVDPSIVGAITTTGNVKVCPGRVVVDHVVSVSKSGGRDGRDLYSAQYVARADVPAWAVGTALVAAFGALNVQPGSSSMREATLSTSKGSDLRILGAL